MLQLKGITKQYDLLWETVHALRKIDLTINDGDFLAIMWPSGSGKSTLMNIIGLLDRPTHGVYLLDDKNVENLTDDQQSQIRSQKIGFVFQTYNLIPRVSVVDQVSLPLSYQGIWSEERLLRATQALEKVWLGDKLYNKPNELSGGQQQRVAIARAIVTNPSVILADEPTGALDTKTGIEVMNILTKLHQEGKTIVMITHSPEVSAYAKHSIHIRDGLLETASASKKNS